MFKSVLLTVDLNQEASWKKALPQAIELVKASGGVLHILSVVPDYGSALVEGFFPPDHVEQVLTKAEGMMEILVADNVPAGIEVKQHLAYGNIHDKVQETLESGDYDLVVMASHAPDRVREFLVGSNADRIVRRSPVSVLVVRG